jgi:hypothetical protein
MTQKQQSRRGRNGQEQPPANDSGLHPQEVIQMGQQAAKLLESPIYNVAHRMCVEETIGAWSSTHPEEVKKREAHWQELQALARVAVQLGSLVDRAKELLEKSQQEDRRSEDEYLDQQGFGEPWPGTNPSSFQ